MGCCVYSVGEQTNSVSDLTWLNLLVILFYSRSDLPPKGLRMGLQSVVGGWRRERGGERSEGSGAWPAWVCGCAPAARLDEEEADAGC